MVCRLAYIPGLELVHAVGLAPTKPLRTPDLQSGAIAAQPRMQKEFQISNLRSRISDLESIVLKKQMKAERWAKEDTLRGTLLLRMATLGTLAKQRRCHPEGSLPSSFQVAQT